MNEIMEVTTEYAPLDRVVPIILERQARRFGSAPLYECQQLRLSYEEMRDVAAGYAGSMAESGLVRGDRVAIMSSNRPEFVPLFLGCAWLGVTSVPINVSSRGFQLQHILCNSNVRLLIIERESLHCLDGLEFSELALECIWVIGGTGDDFCNGQFAGRIVKLPRPGEKIPAVEIGPEAPLTVLYTSGTTGLSKGVICPHAQFFWWGVYTGRQLGVTKDDVLHTPLPLYHTNALNCFFQALLHGASQVVEPKFSVSNFWRAMKESGATVTYLLGAMVPMLLSQPAGPAEREHKVRVALAPGVPGAAAEEFLERTGALLLDGYGTTETNAVIVSTLEARRPGFAGRLSDGFEGRIVDEFDNPLPDGTAGELVLRAREPFSMSLGYNSMPEKSVEACRNLWFHTGDRLVRDADGYFRFVDRMKDAIRRRGENISSYEVEQVLLAHPSVALAAVFPVPSELAEDEVMAAIVLQKGAAVTPEGLIRFCEGKIAYFAIPRFIDFVEQLPVTENGKIKKFELKARGRSAMTWDREVAGVKLRR